MTNEQSLLAQVLTCAPVLLGVVGAAAVTLRAKAVRRAAVYTPLLGCVVTTFAVVGQAEDTEIAVASWVALAFGAVAVVVLAGVGWWSRNPAPDGDVLP